MRVYIRVIRAYKWRVSMITLSVSSEDLDTIIHLWNNKTQIQQMTCITCKNSYDLVWISSQRRDEVSKCLGASLGACLGLGTSSFDVLIGISA